MIHTRQIISQKCAERWIENYYMTHSVFPFGKFKICGLWFTKGDSLDMTGRIETWQVFKRDLFNPYEASQQFVNFELTKERMPGLFG